jgi:indolepyruvate ferredoxin oxidoreductase, alpha subunit
MRITTRLAHSRAGVVRKEAETQNAVNCPLNPKQFILLPAIARRQYKHLLENQPKFMKDSENSGFNKLI